MVVVVGDGGGGGCVNQTYFSVQLKPKPNNIIPSHSIYACKFPPDVLVCIIC